MSLPDSVLVIHSATMSWNRRNPVDRTRVNVQELLDAIDAANAAMHAVQRAREKLERSARRQSQLRLVKPAGEGKTEDETQ
jgi:hypothetical protein